MDSGFPHLVSSPAEAQRKQQPSSVLLYGHLNKGTAYTLEERNQLGLRGLLPPRVETIQEQETRVLRQLQKCTSPIEKYNLLTVIRRDNETLFYHILTNNLSLITPIVYTPTVGQACQEFGQIFKWGEGLYITPSDKGQIRSILDNWTRSVSIIVVSDGSRILGLGDLGAGGMGIPIGKLQLYVAAAGFHPATTLPVLIDTGTNTKKYIEEATYLGVRQPRLGNDQYYPLMDEFLMAVKDKWPSALIQFEDFSNDHCFDLLAAYENKCRCFNDDIQGTGAVIASGFINAIKVTKLDPTKAKIVFLGAGSAGTGVADEIVSVICQSNKGFTPEEARKNFYFLDSRGLITKNRGGRALEPHKLPYARDDCEPIEHLIDVIKAVKPQVLIGLSGVGNSFTEDILTEMGKLNTQPIIFSLSNPTTNSECSAEAAYKATQGRVIFASGSPYDPVHLDGKVYVPGQGNNMYIFPGLGFGAWLCQCTRVSKEMVTAAAIALADTVTEAELANGTIYPDISQIRKLSAAVAARVIETAYSQELATIPRPKDILQFVQSHMYNPSYL